MALPAATTAMRYRLVGSGWNLNHGLHPYISDDAGRYHPTPNPERLSLLPPSKQQPNRPATARSQIKPHSRFCSTTQTRHLFEDAGRDTNTERREKPYLQTHGDETALLMDGAGKSELMRSPSCLYLSTVLSVGPPATPRFPRYCLLFLRLLFLLRLGFYRGAELALRVLQGLSFSFNAARILIIFTIT